MNRPPRPASERSAIQCFVSKDLPLLPLAALWLDVAVAVAADIVCFVVASILVADDAGMVVVVTNKEQASISLIKLEAEIGVAVAPAAAEFFFPDNMTCLKSTPKFSRQYF